MTRILKVILCLLLCASAASATTTVTANLKSALGTAYSADSFVRFRLRGYSGSVPRVSGGVIVVTIPDVSPDSNGLVTTELYNNFEISPAGTYWTVEYWAGGNMISTANYSICTLTSGVCSAGIGTYDLNQATANTVPPVVVAPTGDSTYCRLDAGNCGITGNLTAHSFDRVMSASVAAGSDAGARFSTAITALPSTGGVVDGRGLEGAQTISTDFLSGVTKKVEFLFGASQFTVSSANISFGSNFTYKFNPNTTWANSIYSGVVQRDTARGVDNLIGLQHNHTESSSTATVNTIGNIVAPPLSNATANSDFDIVALWYNDWGLEWRRLAGASNQYSWCWNFQSPNNCSGNTYDAQRHPVLGWYRGDDPNVLDWQAYWLVEYGVKAVMLQNSDGTLAGTMRASTWTDNTKVSYWVNRLMTQTQNFSRLKYALWGAYNDSEANIRTAWAEVITNQYGTYKNVYTISVNGKEYAVIYVFEGETLRTSIGAGTQTFLKDMAALAKKQGFGGLAVMARNGTNQTVFDYADLEANDVLYFMSSYEGQDYLDTTQTTYATYTGSFPYKNDKTIAAAGIPGASRTANLTTFTTTVAHGYSVGDLVIVTGVTDTTFNDSYYIQSVPSVTTFTVNNYGANGTSGAGKVGRVEEPQRRIFGVGTAFKSVSPSTSGWTWDGSTPALFENYLRAAMKFAAKNDMPHIVTVYNVAEWQEGGPGLQPNMNDGFGYLQAVRNALNTTANKGIKPYSPIKMLAAGLQLGKDTFAKATAAKSNITLDNGATDTPGIAFYNANNDNIGIDVLAGNLRFVRKLDESGASVLAQVTSTGQIVGTVATGTAPLSVASTTPVANLAVNNATNLNVSAGVAQGTGAKHGRVTTGSIALSASAAVTLTWSGTAFADTSYSPVCGVVEATASTSTLRLHHIESFTTTTVVARVVNDDGAGAHTGTLVCHAFHD